MIELNFSMLVDQAFMDTIMDRAIRYFGTSRPEIGDFIPTFNNDGLMVEANLLHNPSFHVNHVIKFTQPKLTSSIASILNGFRPNIPSSISLEIYSVILSGNPAEVSDEVIRIVAEIAVFGSCQVVEAV